jgi:hypothetical protein
VNRFDDELRSALSRREPPDGFAERVMARLPGAKRRHNWLPRSWMPAAAAVLIAVFGTGSWEYTRVRQERLEAERAKAELIEALELTSVKLQATRTKLLEKTGGLL